MRLGARFMNIKKTLLAYRLHPRNLSKKTDLITVSKAKVRLELIGAFFPRLTLVEATRLGAIFEHGASAVAAAEKVVEDQNSYFGEDRALLAGIVESRVRSIGQALARGGS
jgi:hypothetical protein